MTSLRDLDIRRVYGPTRGHDALREFLIPAMELAVKYDRVAGYFSSGVLAQAAPGISKLVARGGKIRLVTSHQLVQVDFEILEQTQLDPALLDEIVSEIEASVEQTDQSLERIMKSEYVKAMCWLLKNQQLEIRFIVPSGEASGDFEKFHSKFGIIQDSEGNEIVFTGSANETALGWAGNLENIDTKPLWEESFKEFADYKDTFEDLWSGQNLIGWKTVELPEALNRRLVALAPEGDFPNIAQYEQSPALENKARMPRNYQLEALEEWEGSDRRGLLEMATGTGKTLTARLCIESAAKLGKLFVVLVTPYQHISDQWVKELQEFEVYQVGTEVDWRSQLELINLNSQLGYLEHQIIIAVKNTASTAAFVSLCNQIAENFDNFMFVGDEVHWLGAHTFQAALNEKANFRLGLSATPNRYFDDLGTEVLRAYFGGESVFEFGLAEALNWRNPETGEVGVLTPYEYHPIFVSLNEEEIQDWVDYSRRIQILRGKDHLTRQEAEDLEGLRNQRAEIAKSAESKIPALAELLNELGSGLKQTLIYAANQAQMDAAVAVAREAGIDTGAKITASVGSKPSKKFHGKSERQHILDRFAKGIHPVIFAIAALDEGVDIPSAEIGIILASSGNEKEFIQRRGRLMRKSPGKRCARIFDFIVLPPEERFESLRKKELTRALEFSELAVNKAEVVPSIQDRLGALDE